MSSRWEFCHHPPCTARRHCPWPPCLSPSTPAPRTYHDVSTSQTASTVFNKFLTPLPLQFSSAPLIFTAFICLFTKKMAAVLIWSSCSKHADTHACVCMHACCWTCVPGASVSLRDVWMDCAAWLAACGSGGLGGIRRCTALDCLHKTTHTYVPLYSSSIRPSPQDSLLYTQFSRTHPSSILSSIHSIQYGIYLSLYLNISMCDLVLKDLLRRI
jgi:hypothetical protein